MKGQSGAVLYMCEVMCYVMCVLRDSEVMSCELMLKLWWCLYVAEVEDTLVNQSVVVSTRVTVSYISRLSVAPTCLVPWRLQCQSNLGIPVSIRPEKVAHA